MRLHRHMKDGQVFWTDGSDYPDCPPERGCWAEVTPFEAALMLLYLSPADVNPDLWFDGRWEDPDDWRHDPLLRKVKRDMHARVGAAPFLGGEFGRAMDEPFMPRLEALT